MGGCRRLDRPSCGSSRRTARPRRSGGWCCLGKPSTPAEALAAAKACALGGERRSHHRAGRSQRSHRSPSRRHRDHVTDEAPPARRGFSLSGEPVCAAAARPALGYAAPVRRHDLDRIEHHLWAAGGAPSTQAASRPASMQPDRPGTPATITSPSSGRDREQVPPPRLRPGRRGPATRGRRRRNPLTRRAFSRGRRAGRQRARGGSGGPPATTRNRPRARQGSRIRDGGSSRNTARQAAAAPSRPGARRRVSGDLCRIQGFVFPPQRVGRPRRPVSRGWRRADPLRAASES
ncbi:hypothetical protein ABH991_001504 [Bradyrhizobium ottawaense]|uniref:Uncharacterized protein n=1 Tax=Bradyrhizobium ottawaense TaxID=931866 RepID=A0ABV4FPU1_9BRAD